MTSWTSVQVHMICYITDLKHRRSLKGSKFGKVYEITASGCTISSNLKHSTLQHVTRYDKLHHWPLNDQLHHGTTIHYIVNQNQFNYYKYVQTCNTNSYSFEYA